MGLIGFSERAEQNWIVARWVYRQVLEDGILHCPKGKGDSLNRAIFQYTIKPHATTKPLRIARAVVASYTARRRPARVFSADQGPPITDYCRRASGDAAASIWTV